MMGKRIFQSLIAVLVLLAPLSLLSQVATGPQPYGSFSGGPDVTNLGNLNVHYTFPIFSKPGRGLPFNYYLSFDSSVWTRPGTSWAPVGNWGWRGAMDPLTGWLEVTRSTLHCVTGFPKHQVPVTVWNFVNFHDGNGVIHPIADADSVQGTACTDPDASTGDAIDGSGYTVVPVAGTGSASVISPSGQVVGNSPTAPGFGDGTITDSNGNQISSANGVYTDTLGMNVLTATGGAPNPLVFTYTDSTNTARAVTVNYSTYTVKTNFGCAGISEYGPTSNSLVSSVVYPDGSQYSFTYEPTPGFAGDVTGRIQSVTLPTGATITYNYTGGSNGVACADGGASGFDRVTADGTTSYSRSGSGTASTTTFLDASSPTRNQTVINFQTAFNNFYETHRTIYQGASTVLLQTDTCYNGAVAPCGGTAVTLPFTSIGKYLTLSNNQQSLTTTSFNSFGLPTELDEYDFGSGAPGPLLRKTLTTYAALNGPVDRPASIIVQDGSGNQKAASTFAYDETAVTAVNSPPMYVGPSGSRGNLTTLSRWLDTTGTNLSTTFTYDATGNVLTSTDPGGHQTQFLYTDSFSDGVDRASLAYVTKVTLPVTHSPNATNHVTSMQYEPNTGLPSKTTDQNSQQTTFTYDPMLRPLLTNFPDGGQTSISYPSPTQAVVQNKIDSARSTYSTTLLDTYGRVKRTAIANAESTPYDLADVCYDSNGRPSFQSYPYQAAGYTGAQVCSGAGDSAAYDGAGRVTQLTHSDSSKIQYSYNGRATQTTDEGNGSYNVSRIEQSDGLGRLTGVCEVTSVNLLGNGGSVSGCGLDITATGFLTSYSYNTLSNLTQVTQGSLVNRTFSFDSLSRMTSESEPEWGSGSAMSYAYNSDGLLTQRTRPAPNQTNPAVTVTTNYGYDELHRLRSRTYTGDPSGTPTAGFNYDESIAWTTNLSNTIGRLSSESAGSTTGQIFGYDAMGRPLINWQCTPRVCGTNAYLLSYGYDLAGDMTSASNGAGVTFGYSYNTAARIAGMTSTFVDSQHPGTLLSNVRYNQFGPVSDTLGNGLNETMGYSARGIPQSYSSTPYSFGLGLAANGTITSGNDTANGNWSYGYDQFNRLVSSSKTTAPAQGFSYVYDRNGNRLQQNVTQGTGPAPQYTFDNNNRIAGSGVTYDALGNIQTDGLGNTFTYDAESRLIKVVNAGGTYNYTYDAEGRRIRNNTSEFLYDLSGRAITLFGATDGIWNYGEIYAGGRHLATYSGSTTNFMHTDWLGSKRVMSGMNGVNAQTCTTLPFGDGSNCSGTEWNFNHFTDDIHDPESNLEHTWFRQLSGTQGRWMSPDPYLGSMDVGNPQSLNRYGYVVGDPMDMIDPLGLQTKIAETDNTECWWWADAVTHEHLSGTSCFTIPMYFAFDDGSGDGSGGGGDSVNSNSPCSAIPSTGMTQRIPINSASDFRVQFNGNGQLIGLGIQLTGSQKVALPGDSGVIIPPNTYVGITLNSPNTISFGFSNPVRFSQGLLTQGFFQSATFSNGQFTSVQGTWTPFYQLFGNPTTDSSILKAALNAKDQQNIRDMAASLLRAANVISQWIGCTSILGR